MLVGDSIKKKEKSKVSPWDPFIRRDELLLRKVEDFTIPNLAKFMVMKPLKQIGSESTLLLPLR